MIRALLVDAGGTLLTPTEPVAATYARVARDHGHARSVEEIRRGFRRAFHAEWPGLRYQGAALAFWRQVVFEATSTRDEALFRALYEYYRHPDAWRVADGALDVLEDCRTHGVRTGIVSNWDTRLRPLLDAMELSSWFDVIAISAEHQTEKPDPELLQVALDALGVAASEAVLVGDSDEDERAGAAAGVETWRLPGSVRDFHQVRERLSARRVDDGA